MALKFKRRRFWSAGVMDIICFDQHDKWKRFCLWLHVGLDPYSGRIVWMRIWWTNRNPKLVTSYYLAACRHAGGTPSLPTFPEFIFETDQITGIPLITQSDLGSENYGIANCHTVTRQRLDPTLEGTMQHRWMHKKTMNVKPEALWSQMRRQFTPGFENILDTGVHEGLYDVSQPIERYVYFIFYLTY